MTKSKGVVVPGENIDLDVDDPRQVERAPA